MLNIKGLEKTFNRGTPDERKVLRGIDLHLEEGEFVTIVGGNGAGKTTLFNAISGAVLPDGGRVELGEYNITYWPEHRRAAYIGRIFQDPLKGTAPNLTVEENLAIAYMRSTGKGALRRISKKEKAFLREKLVELNLGLEDRINTKIGLLSGGQRQAVTLVMATLVKPKLLLLDEHTAALDPVSAGKVMELTNRIVGEQNITTMMITHNIKSALQTGARILMLDDGAVVVDVQGTERASMTMEELLAKYSRSRQKDFDCDRTLL